MPCDHCGSHAPTKNVFFMRHIGLVLVFLHQHVKGNLCRRCIDRAFLGTFLPTLFLGWWGILSFFATLVVLPVDLIVYLGCLSVPRQAHVPALAAAQGGFGQPSSGFGQPGFGQPGFGQPGFGQPAPSGFGGAVPPAVEAPARRKRRWILAAVLGIPVLTCCLSGVGLVGWGAVESQQLAALEDACNGRGVADAPTYSPTPGVHRVVALVRGTNGYAVDYDVLPEEWETGHADEAELVLCLEEEQETIVERCEYVDEGGGPNLNVIERTSYSQQARVVAARTGEVLGTTTLAGTTPQGCNDSEIFYGNGVTVPRPGSHVGPNEVSAFLQPHVLGRTAAVPSAPAAAAPTPATVFGKL